MLISEIIDLREAPIADLTVHGMEKPGTFPDVDRKLLTNPSHIEKLHKRFANTPFLFNFHFVNLHDRQYVKPNAAGDKELFTGKWKTDADKYSGIGNSRRVWALTGLDIAPDPKAITVVFVSNSNVTNSIPMTPWIVAHRFGHAISDRYKALPTKLKRLFFSFRGSAQDFSTGLQVLRCLTTRSARENILGFADGFEEFVAQYLMQGKITLRVPADALDAPPDEEVAERSAEMSQIMEEMIAACVGHIFILV